jgi:hypothetical protein
LTTAFFPIVGEDRLGQERLDLALDLDSAPGCSFLAEKALDPQVEVDLGKLEHSCEVFAPLGPIQTNLFAGVRRPGP